MFHLKVQKVEQSCLFELSWGRGQQLSVTVPFPENLSVLYQDWKSVYLSFYKSALRGRVVDDGAGIIPSAPMDWHAQLVQAEAKLLYELHQWLRLGELFEIRSCIARAAVEQRRGQGEEHQKTPLFVDVFLTCNPLELARLPWEAWELGSEFATTGKIRFFRTPPMIQGVTATPKHCRPQPRILAILGDETGLNFQEDRAALRSLDSIADIQFVGWQPRQDI
ncbi:MAG TPA: histidine kinase, partial [Cyanophyceae cyanobacterium]